MFDSDTSNDELIYDIKIELTKETLKGLEMLPQKNELNEILGDIDLIKNELIKFIKNPLKANFLDFKKVLLESIHKNLIEISLLNQKEEKIEKFDKFYYWYSNKKQYFYDLYQMKENTAKQDYQYYDDDSEYTEEDEKKEPIQTYKRDKDLYALYKYKLSNKKGHFTRNIIDHSYKNIKINNQCKQKESNKLEENFNKKLCMIINHKTNLENQDYNFDNKSINKKHNILEEEYKKYLFPNFNKLEEKIMNDKLRIMKSKRNKTEIKSNLDIFGNLKAKYKEGINKKNELKDIINLFKISKNKSILTRTKTKITNKEINERIKLNKAIFSNDENLKTFSINININKNEQIDNNKYNINSVLYSNIFLEKSAINESFKASKMIKIKNFKRNKSLPDYFQSNKSSSELSFIYNGFNIPKTKLNSFNKCKDLYALKKSISERDISKLKNYNNSNKKQYSNLFRKTFSLPTINKNINISFIPNIIGGLLRKDN